MLLFLKIIYNEEAHGFKEGPLDSSHQFSYDSTLWISPFMLSELQMVNLTSQLKTTMADGLANEMQQNLMEL